MRFNVTSASEEKSLLHFYHSELSSKLRVKGIEPPSLDVLRESVEIAFGDMHRALYVSTGGTRAALWAFKSRAQNLMFKLDHGHLLENSLAYARALGEAFPSAQWDFRKAPGVANALRQGISSLPEKRDMCFYSEDFY